MKTLRFTLPVFIAVVISYFVISGGLVAGTPASSSDMVRLAPLTYAEMPSFNNSVDNSSAGDSSFTDSVAATPSEVLTFNDPYWQMQWALSQIQIQELWLTANGGSGILVAILDTGIDQDHEDLVGKVVFEGNLTDSPTPTDVYGHGTHIAGIIAAHSNNGVGIAGVAPECQLINIKVADDRGRCDASRIAAGIIWAVDEGANVINVSIELRDPSPALEEAINYAWGQGVVVIAAAGNEGTQKPVYPAAYEHCLAVAATRQDNTLAPLSNYGDWVGAAAPGHNIFSTLPDDSYGYEDGTSFASAYASGLAALLFGVVTDTNGNGRLNDEVRAALEEGYPLADVDGID